MLGCGASTRPEDPVTSSPSAGSVASSPRRLRAGVLWGGGVATAVVAALVAVVGSLVCDAILDIELLPASQPGVLGWSSQASYPVGAAVVALAATGVLHLLLVAVPQPMRFFGWLMALVAAIVAVAPFGYGEALDSQVATAAVDLIAVLSIWSLLSGVARRAVSVAAGRPAHPM